MRSGILVIDDDEKITSMLRRGLAFEGYDVHIANNGTEGLSKVLAVDPDLIILDVMMPMIDGFEVLMAMEAAMSGWWVHFYGMSTDSTTILRAV